MAKQQQGISRVIMAYRLENLDSAVQNFTDVLGIDDMEGPRDFEEIGLRIAISWKTGIECIAPLASGWASEGIRQHIDTHGEGVSGIVYRVSDLDEADQRAAACGFAPTMRLNPLDVNAKWAERFRYIMESPLPPVAGVDVTLIQIDPK